MIVATKSQSYPPATHKTRQLLARRLSHNRYLYLLLLPALTLILLFNYLPMYGLVIVFKDYKLMQGVLGSDWVGLLNFKKLVLSPSFSKVLLNTLIISFYRLIFGFPAPIILGLLLNEIRHPLFKKQVQTISYLPYFMSWVALGGMIASILSPTRGIVSPFLDLLDLESIHLLVARRFFRPLLVVTGIWQSVGWGSVIYLAVLSSINPELYEVAKLDGANRFRLAVHISIPSLIPVMTVLLLLNMATVLHAGFDQIFNLYSPLVYDVADIIDTFVYRRGLIESDYSFAATVGLFQNAVGFVLLIAANTSIKRFSDYGIW